MADRASFDVNEVPSLLAVSNGDGSTIVSLEADPTTHELLVKASVTFAANSSVNVNQIGGTAVLTGNGVTGAGSQRVTIASDQTAFSVNATLSAETTKVIGVTRSADGAGNLLTSTGSALDINLKTSAATLTVASHAVTNVGTFAVQATEADGANTTLGAKADAKSTATDTTAITIMSVLKQISASVQAPPSQAVTNTGTFAVQATLQASSAVVGHVIADTGSTTAVTGTVTTSETPPTTVLNGKKTVTTAGTRVTLAASTACKSVTIKALAANTGTIYVGDTTVAASNGFALAASDSVTLDISNLTTVNIDSSINGEGVTYLGVN